MPAPDIAAATRYFPRATTRYVWVPTIAVKTAPTRLELNAGTDLTRDLAGVTGFKTKSAQSPTPDLGSRFTGSIPGEITAEESTITVYADRAGVDARALMPRDATGNIVRYDGGDVASRKMDVFPVTVGAVNKAMGVEDGSATLEFSYTINSEPAESIAVPA